LLVAAILLVQPSFAQNHSTFYFSRFGWSLELPSDFKLVSSNTTESIKESGQELLEKSSCKTINRSDVVELITAAKDTMSFINANYNISKKITSENWLEANRQVKATILISYIKQLSYTPKIKSHNIFIDGVKFDEFSVDFDLDQGQVYHLVYLATFIKGHYFTITYSYTDAATGIEIREVLNGSKFKK